MPVATLLCQVAGAQAERTEEVRARLQAQREEAETRFEREEVGCYQRFAVASCLMDVKARRRVALEELQRQENILDDAERRQRGAERLRLLEEKAAAAESAQAQARREQAQQAYEEKQQRAQRKRQEGVDTTGSGDVPREAGLPGAVEEAAGGASPDAQQAREAYESKLRRAQERKAQRQRQLEERKDKRARPLPVPQ
ncbi:MAG: hypothetical protein OEW36_01100 [Hylemonella sp.]|nr:hypothetical protein [Hylemonella sp.]